MTGGVGISLAGAAISAGGAAVSWREAKLARVSRLHDRQTALKLTEVELLNSLGTAPELLDRALTSRQRVCGSTDQAGELEAFRQAHEKDVEALANLRKRAPEKESPAPATELAVADRLALVRELQLRVADLRRKYEAALEADARIRSSLAEDQRAYTAAHIASTPPPKRLLGD